MNSDPKPVFLYIKVCFVTIVSIEDLFSPKVLAMFANRIAVVTGGGSGIGRAVAQRLAKERASVVIADQNLNGAKETKQLIDGNSSDAKHIAVECDVSRMDSVKNLFHTLVDNYSNKAATLLVNSAGITRDKFIVDMSEQDFDKVIAVNLKGTFLATQVSIRSPQEWLANGRWFLDIP